MKDIEKLVEKVKSGNEKAFSELYEITQEKAYYTALKITKNPEDAQDMLQDSYVKAYKNLDSLKDNKKFVSWFNCIVANNCRNYLVKKKLTFFSELSDEDSDYDFEDTLEDERSLSPAEFSNNEELKKMIMDCIDKLPEEHKVCVIMFYYDEMSIKEIAESLEISEGTVKSRLYNAKKKLKEEFDKMEKKGTKLYGIPVVPIIKWAFFTDSKDSHVPKLLYRAIRKAIFGTAAKGAIASTATTTATIVGNKLLVAAIAVAVIGTATTAGVIAYNEINNDSSKTSTTQYVTTTEKTKSKNDIEYNLGFGDYAAIDDYNNKVYLSYNNKVYAQDIDGNEQEVIFNKQASSILFDGKLYFVSGGKLYVKDKEVEELFLVNSYYIFKYNNQLYGINKNKTHLYQINIDEKNEILIKQNVSNLEYIDGYVLARNSSGNVIKFKPNDSAQEFVVFNYYQKERIKLPYSVDGDTSYFTEFSSDSDGKIYINNSGSVTSIQMDNSVLDFKVVDGDIYYASFSGLYIHNNDNDVLIKKGDFSFSCEREGYLFCYESGSNKTYIIHNSNVIKTIEGCVTNAQIVQNKIIYKINNYVYCSDWR